MSQAGLLVPQAWFGEEGWRAALITSERRGGGAGVLSFQRALLGCRDALLNPDARSRSWGHAEKIYN